MRNPKKKIPLEREKEILDQYGRPFGDEDFLKKRGYPQAIGNFLISFSHLETSLDHLIITMISDRSDEPGYRVVKYLNFRNKIKLAKEEYWQAINFISQKRLKEKNKKQFEIIFKKLTELSEFRNKIAHANWMTLDERGYVRVKVGENSGQGGVQFENIKMAPILLYKFTRQAHAVADRIDSFQEKVFEDLFRPLSRKIRVVN